jgi:hypothetical protein
MALMTNPIAPSKGATALQSFLCKEKLHPAEEVSTISGLELNLPG